MKKLGFNIVLLGMIASGKDTQANILKKKYPLKLVEPGLFSRKLLKKKGELGDLARQTIGKGAPAPTLILQKFLVGEIEKKPKNKNLLFIGGRLKPEAELINKLMTAGGERLLAFYISLPDKEVYKRSLARSKGNMKEVFKVLDNKKLITERIKWHKDEIEKKTVKYYESLGIMRKINGSQPIPKVTKDILEAIEEYTNKKD